MTGPQIEGDQVLPYLARILFPVIGSWLGFLWFGSVVSGPERMKAANLIREADYLAGTRRRMSHVSLYALAVAATLYTGIDYYNILKFQDQAMDVAWAWPHGYQWLLLAGDVVWWYFIWRTLEMAVLVFLDYRTLLNEPGLPRHLSLFDEVNAFGLDPVLRQARSFLLLYIIVVGTYLLFYDTLWIGGSGAESGSPQNASVWLSGAVWLLYFILPLHGFLTVFWPAVRLVTTAKKEKMLEMVAAMEKLRETGEVEKLEPYEKEYERLKALKLPLLPFGTRRILAGLSLFPILKWLNVIALAVKLYEKFFETLP